MKFIKATIILFVLLPIITKSQVIIDTSLLNNSYKWKPKIGLLVISNVLKKVSLGPIETIDIAKGEKKISRSKERSFQSENGAWGFVKDYRNEKSQPFSITALYKGTDTIILNMNMVTISQGHVTGIIHSKKELPQTGVTSIYCEQTLIATQNDTTLWLLKKNTTMAWNFYELEIGSLISSSGDTLSIYPAKGFRKKLYQMGLHEGIVFIRDGLQIAAYQQTPRYLWLRNNLNENYKQIFGAAIISILSDYHNEYY